MDKIRVSVLVIPDAMLSTLGGIYDVLTILNSMGGAFEGVPEGDPYRPEFVAAQEKTPTTSGLKVTSHRLIRDIPETDVVIVPSVLVDDDNWITGRYPEEVAWLGRMHERGALLCSACSGVLLMAETGLLDDHEVTVHWAFERTLRENFPSLRLRLGEVLVVAGERQEFVMSGASSSWHDLVLYLVARQVGTGAAQAMARYLLMDWHHDGQTPYIGFDRPDHHGDAAILAAQEWAEQHYAEPGAVDEMARHSGLAERTFKRRFARATHRSPIAYVQQLRIEAAKRHLEQDDLPIDEISWQVGYEDPAFFRRLFKRLTGLTPGLYRKKFRVPDYAVG